MRRVLLVLIGVLLPLTASAQSVILGEYRPGRAAAAASLSMTLSTEDKAVLDAMAASLSVIDDWDETDRAKVNLIVGQAGIAAGNGSSGVTVPRWTLADDSTGRLRIWDGTDTALVDASGNLQVVCPTCSGTGASKTDDGAFVIATDPVAPAGFLFDDVTPDSVNEGDVGLGRMSANRNQYVSIRDAAGNERGLNIDASGQLAITVASLPSHAVTNAGTFAVQADTEFPIGVVGADNMVNPTTVQVHALNYSWDGANWDRSTASLITEITHDATITPATTVTQALLAQFDDTAPDSVDENDGGLLRISGNRNLYVSLRDAAGNERGLNIDASGNLTANITGTVTVGSHAVTNAGTFAVQAAPTAATSGGADSLKYTSAGSTEDEHAVKTSAGTLYSITATNTNAAARYLRCENDTAANTAPGSETPELDLAIPGQTGGAGFTTTFPLGYSFSTALTCWLVTGAADTDVAEVAANEIKVFYTFK